MPSDQPHQWPARTDPRQQSRLSNPPNTAHQQGVQQSTQQAVQHGQQTPGAATGQPNQQPHPAQFQGQIQPQQTMGGQPRQGQIPRQQPANQPMPQSQPQQRQGFQAQPQIQQPQGQQVQQPQGQQGYQPQGRQMQRPQQTSQPQMPQQQPGPGQVQLVEHGDEYVHVRFRDPDAFDTIRTPDWAAHAARSISEGAEVRTGKLKGSDDWKIESVLIRRPVDERTAVQKAQQIVRKIED